MKTCFKCKRELELSEFYRHPKMADGRLGKCKECTRRDVNENRKEKRDYYLEYDRTRYYAEHEKRKKACHSWSKKHPDIANRAKAAHRRNHPEKYAATNAVYNALRNGRLIKSPCSGCGSVERVHGHHEDYTKPLDVVWLCPSCHGLRHAEINRERRRSGAA